MTLASTAPIVTYLENGSTTAFAVPFQFQASTELVVVRQDPSGVRTTATLGADYSVSGGAGATGSITTMAAKASGWTLEISRYTARTQPLDLTPGDTFPAESLEGALSRGVAIAQELEAKTDDAEARALRVPKGETAALLPAAAARVGRVPYFNETTGAVEVKTAAELFADVPVTVTGAPGQSVPTLGALAGIAAPVSGQTAFLADTIRSGWFEWITGDQSANVAGDPYSRLFKAHATIPATLGCWLRLRGDLLGIDLRDFGITGGTGHDFTAEFNNAILQAKAAGGGRIVCPTGIIDCNPFLPAYAFDNATTQLIPIEIVGAGFPSMLFGTKGSNPMASKGCTILRSVATTGDVIAVASSTSDFSCYALSLKNLVVRAMDNPTVGGVNAKQAIHLHAENVMVETGVYSRQAAQPTHTTVGLWPPKLNNGALNVLRNVSVSGFDTGLAVEEHTFGDYVNVTACIKALAFQTAYHSSAFSRLQVQDCTKILYADSGTHRTEIGELGIEYAAAGRGWQETTYAIDDASNYIYCDRLAKLAYLEDAGTTPSATFAVNGGRNVNWFDIGKPLPRVALPVRTSSLSVPTGTETFVDFSATIFEGAQPRLADPTYVDLTELGLFEVSFSGRLAGNAAGSYREGRLYFGAAAIDYDPHPPAGTLDVPIRLGPRILNVTSLTGAYVRVSMKHDVGSAINLVADTTGPALTIKKLRTASA